MSNPITTKKLLDNVLTKLNQVIQDGETVLDKEGNSIHQEAAPAYFAQAINLLKHLGENGQSDKPSLKKKLQELSVPFSQEDPLDMRH